MFKAIFLLLLSCSLFAAEEHATVSVQRWQNKIVVSINHEEGWHTYWKNPGDAGIASTFNFSKEVKAFEWPVPKRYKEEGDIQTIGYSGTQHFFFEDISGAFELHVGMLICKEICIPGEAKLKLSEKEAFSSNRMAKPYDHDELSYAFKKIPKEGKLPQGFEYYLTREKDQTNLTLHYSLKSAGSNHLPEKLNLLTGFPHIPWGYKREELFYKDNTLFGKMQIEWDGEYQEPPMPLPNDGNFKQAHVLKFLINYPGAKEVQVVKLKLENFSIATAALNDFYKRLSPISETMSEVKFDAPMTGYIIEYLIFAFLGGLILNLMPCVLPVISLKLFGLIKHQDLPQSKLLKHNLTYTLGVITTFIGLAGIIAGIKSAGEQVGWGFQLQSPAFTLIMMLVLFILSLNLFGLFEFTTPGGGRLGSTELSEGFTGDFLSGVLTTILSTPCSAPFLGTALTFAFTTTNLNIFLVFIFIGIGLSFPFIMTGLFPGTLHVLPRPGIWMEKLKYFLGLSLILTVIWLYDVFVSLVNFDVVSWKLNLLFGLWFFAFFFANKISTKRSLQIVMFLVPIILTVMAMRNLELKPTQVALSSKSSELWQPWSEEKMISERGNTVFIDFTAEWCLTCKVNKKLVLETESFKELTTKNNLTLLRADWTRRDDNITQFLKKYNVVGVPAYFIQKESGEVVFLGETISVSKIKETLRK